MRIKMILPALTEATSPLIRPIKYSLFPPLGLATLAAYTDPEDVVTITDEHVEKLRTDDDPDLVVIQVYITSAFRAYRVADLYRARGCYVVLGGLHVTSLPDEAAQHADTIFLGPGEDTWPQFLRDLRNCEPKKRYQSQQRSLLDLPPVRRDLIKRHLYLVPNSIVVSVALTSATSVTRKPFFTAANLSTRKLWMPRSLRSNACLASICTFSTITSSATCALPRPSSRACGVWDVCGRQPAQ
jgi:radical SAM superfamily enzyme YgiQ (UPF0313 family)